MILQASLHNDIDLRFDIKRAVAEELERISIFPNVHVQTHESAIVFITNCLRNRVASHNPLNDTFQYMNGRRMETGSLHGSAFIRDLEREIRPLKIRWWKSKTFITCMRSVLMNLNVKNYIKDGTLKFEPLEYMFYPHDWQLVNY